MRYRVMLMVQLKGENPKYGASSIHTYASREDAVLDYEPIANAVSLPLHSERSEPRSYPCFVIAAEN